MITEKSQEVAAMMQFSNEVRYERNEASALAWIEKAKVIEERYGRFETQFSARRFGRQWIVSVHRSGK